MLPNIKHWFGRSRRERDEQIDNAVATINANRVFAPPGQQARQFTFLDMEGPAAFLAASQGDPRDEVLRKHPFWNDPQTAMQSLDAETLGKVLEHIEKITAQYSISLHYGLGSFHYDSDDDDEERVRSMKGMQWGKASEYLAWQQQAFVLAQQEPMHARSLMDTVAEQIRLNGVNEDEDWPAQAAHFLDNGGVLSANNVLDGLYCCVDATKLNETLAQYTVLRPFLNDPQHDEAAIAWGATGEKKLSWLAQYHRRLSSWEMAEGISDVKLIAGLAELARDGALLKAWHGIALTGEETAQHPLAYSLYVHKHAPIYMEEAQPLPDVWSMALSLCNSGVDFRNMLLMAAKAKVSPQATPDVVELPDLGMQHEH